MTQVASEMNPEAGLVIWPINCGMRGFLPLSGAESAVNRAPHGADFSYVMIVISSS